MSQEVTPEVVERVQALRELLNKMCLAPDQTPVIMTENDDLKLIAGIDDDENVIVVSLIKGERMLISADSLLAGKRENPKHIKPITPE